MPFHVRKFKTGWRVYDDKGKSFSKKPLSKKTATAQLRALYANVPEERQFRGSGYCCMDKDLYLDGDGFFSDLFSKAKSAVKGVVNRITGVSKGIRQGFQPKARSIFDKYGNYIITNIFIRRKPIFAILDRVLNLLSLGKWTEAKAKYGYDSLFHLSMVFLVRPPDRPSGSGGAVYIKVEKNEVPDVEVYDYRQVLEQPYIQFGVPCCMTLNQVMNNAQNLMGPNFYTYDAFQNNCQVFIQSILKASGLLTERLNEFIMQDTEGILKQLPSYIQPFSRKITDIAGLANVALEGQGKAITMTAKDFIAEHKKLVALLNETSGKLKKEAMEQAGEAKAKTGVNVGGRAINPKNWLYATADEDSAFNREEEDQHPLDRNITENDRLPIEISDIMDMFEGEDFDNQIREIRERYTINELNRIRAFLQRHARFNLVVPYNEGGYYQVDIPLIRIIDQALELDLTAGNGRMRGGASQQDYRTIVGQLYEIRMGVGDNFIDDEEASRLIVGVLQEAINKGMTKPDIRHYMDNERQINYSNGFKNWIEDVFAEFWFDPEDTEDEESVDEMEEEEEDKDDEMRGGNWKTKVARFAAHFGLPLTSAMITNQIADDESGRTQFYAMLITLATTILSDVAQDKWRNRKLSDAEVAAITNKLRKIQEAVDDKQGTMTEGQYLERMNELQRSFNALPSRNRKEATIPTWAKEVLRPAPAPATDDTAIEMIENPIHTNKKPSGSGKPTAIKIYMKMFGRGDSEDELAEIFSNSATMEDKEEKKPSGRENRMMNKIEPEKEAGKKRKRSPTPEKKEEPNKKKPVKGKGNTSSKKKVVKDESEFSVINPYNRDAEPDVVELTPVASVRRMTIQRDKSLRASKDMEASPRKSFARQSAGEITIARPVSKGKTTLAKAIPAVSKIARSARNLIARAKHTAPVVAPAPKKGCVSSIKKMIKGKGISAKFEKQLATAGIDPKAYLRKARAAAKKAGYDGRAVEFADDNKHKLMIYDDKGTPVRFGAVANKDFIIYSATDKANADKKRKAYLARATKIKGDWKANKFSPNNLAISVLW